MKTRLLTLLFTIILAAGIASCKGPEGPQGPVGALGPKGDQGYQYLTYTSSVYQLQERISSEAAVFIQILRYLVQLKTGLKHTVI